MDIQGKIAIVTGVSSGIGYATVLELLEQGAKVVGWGRHDPEIKSDYFIFIQTDVQDQEQVERAFDQSIAIWDQQVDVLVNNAGIAHFAPTEKMDMEKWHTMFNVNVHGMYYCTRQVIPQMRQQQRGHIINISSIAGTNGIKQGAGYAGTKHAVRGMSHSWFRELREDNIKVSCLYPGSVNTHFFDNVEGTTANETMLNPRDIAQTICNVIKTPDNFLTVDVEMRPMNPRYS
jgi:NADP-dependent 3-hydroxy acid dehydrogenase YdfG